MCHGLSDQKKTLTQPLRGESCTPSWLAASELSQTNRTVTALRQNPRKPTKARVDWLELSFSCRLWPHDGHLEMLSFVVAFLALRAKPPSC